MNESSTNLSQYISHSALAIPSTFSTTPVMTSNNNTTNSTVGRRLPFSTLLPRKSNVHRPLPFLVSNLVDDDNNTEPGSPLQFQHNRTVPITRRQYLSVLEKASSLTDEVNQVDAEIDTLTSLNSLVLIPSPRSTSDLSQIRLDDYYEDPVNVSSFTFSSVKTPEAYMIPRVKTAVAMVPPPVRDMYTTPASLVPSSIVYIEDHEIASSKILLPDF